jgi:hypothetical protein
MHATVEMMMPIENAISAPSKYHVVVLSAPVSFASNARSKRPVSSVRFRIETPVPETVIVSSNGCTIAVDVQTCTGSEAIDARPLV